MKTLPLYFLTLLTVSFWSSYLQGQNNNNEIVVKQVYDVLQNKKATSNEISALTNKINWEEVKSKKNHWQVYFP